MKNFNTLRDIPILSPLGFQKMPIPEALFNKIQNAYTLLKSAEKEEVFEGRDKFITNSGDQPPVYLMPMDLYPALRDEILADFGDILQAWVKVPIQPLFLYGIRSYRHGSALSLHVDRIMTHHVSAIVCVDKAVVEDWALDICDHAGEWHNVYLNPGEMVLYESAICQHGRLKPLNGRFYNNLFVHYSLV
jgi:prolyl 4-hydroxylase